MFAPSPKYRIVGQYDVSAARRGATMFLYWTISALCSPVGFRTDGALRVVDVVW